MPMFSEFTINIISTLAVLFIVALGIVVLVVAVLFVIDKTQHADAIRRNYPVLGRFRHLFTELGEFFRQYFFAMEIGSNARAVGKAIRLRSDQPAI